jgi:predicted DNA-binding transcriptional regulator AlpA
MNEPLAISIRRTAKLLDCSTKHVYFLIKTNPTFPKPFKLGASTRILSSELHAWLEEKSRLASEAWQVRQSKVSRREAAMH